MSANQRPSVGQGHNCVVLLDGDPGVMTPDEAEALALDLIRAADRSRIRPEKGLGEPS